MPAILAIETSTRVGSVALACDGVVLAGARFQAERSHNARIFEPLGALLGRGDRIDAVVVGTGPGSYTGVRIGIACGVGLSLARGIPLAGLPSVCALDEASPYTVVGDARRGFFFRCRVVDGRLRGEPELLTLEALGASMPEGAVWTFDARPPLPGARAAVPSAAALARLASRLPAGEIQALGTRPVEPIYLAAAFVTRPGKRGARTEGREKGAGDP